MSAPASFEADPSAIHAALRAADLSYSALSWNGFNLVGDRASIDEVKRLIHVEGRMKCLQETLYNERASKI